MTAEFKCRYCGQTVRMASPFGHTINIADIIVVKIPDICSSCASDFALDITQAIIDAERKLRRRLARKKRR